MGQDLRFTRRETIVGGLSLSIGMALGTKRLLAAASESLPSPLVVVITGLDAETPASRLVKFQKELLGLRIPVAVCVRPTSRTGVQLTTSSPLARGLRGTLDAHSELFEVALDAEEFGSNDPYFQLREVSDAQSVLARALNTFQNARRPSTVTAETLSTSTPSMGREHLACLRAAGIRTVVHIPTRAKVEHEETAGYWLTATHLAKTFALTTTSVDAGPRGITPSFEEMRTILLEEARRLNPIVVHVRFTAFDNLDDVVLERSAQQLAKILSDMREGGAARILLPATLYRQTVKGPVQYIVVRVDDFRVPHRQEEQSSLVMELLQKGIPVSESLSPGILTANIQTPLQVDPFANWPFDATVPKPAYDVAAYLDDQEDFGSSLERGVEMVSDSVRVIYAKVGRVPTAFVASGENFNEDALLAIAECGSRMVSTDDSDHQLASGVGRTGLLTLTNLVKFEGDESRHSSAEILQMMGGRGDAVLVVGPETASPRNMAHIPDVFSELSERSDIKLVNFSQYYDAVLPRMPLVEIVREARAQRRVSDPLFSLADVVTTDDLRADAETAWRYFDEMSGMHNGLVLGTAWEVSGKLEGYAFATMWDLGSLLMAYCSAYQLGIIDQTRFEVASRGVLDFLDKSSFRFRNTLLPDIEMPIRKDQAPRKGFDAIDTGRLLIGLKRLDNLTRHSLPVRTLINKWDFRAALAEGQMHNITAGGRVMSVHDSSYALYAAQGYGLWDLELRPVFAVEQPAANMDTTLTFLKEVARRGAVATEPWTTHHIELSPSEHTTIIEDILYAAQIRRTSETGYLTSVSEMAIDRDPWFIYQGYQIDPDGGAWRVDTSTANARFANAEFVASTRAVSTKGAFLWLATRPGEYAAQLHRLVREKCRTGNLGFSSGIYELSGTPSRLADVNTNGLILEAIEYILSDNAPLLPRHEQ